MKKFNLPFIRKIHTINFNKIFKQLPEKKEKQVLNRKIKFPQQAKAAMALIFSTILILSFTYTNNYLKTHENNVYSTNSFTITEDGKELCKVRNPKLLKKTLSKLENEMGKKYKHEIKIENKFKAVESKAKDREIATEKELYNILKSNINYSILAYAVNVNGKKVGVVSTEDEAKKAVEEVKNQFTQNYDKNSIVEVSTVENIKINQVKASNTEIKSKDDLVNYIMKGVDEEQKYIVKEGDTYWTIAEHFNMTLDELISANIQSNPDKIQIGDELNLVVPKPFVNVQVKRKIKQKENTPYETEYNRVSYMYSDEQIIDRKGEYGVSEIESMVTEQNGTQIAKEVISEDVITNPVSEVVTTGIQDPPPKKGTGYFVNPLPGSYISSRFGSRSGGFHLGQDMAKSAGSSISAADGGTVTYAGWSGSYGYMVDIDHGGGFTTRYGHCSEIYVSVGEKVYQGKVIAAVGSTGFSTGPHLHFEVRKYGSVVNPSTYIGTQYR